GGGGGGGALPSPPGPNPPRRIIDASRPASTMISSSLGETLRSCCWRISSVRLSLCRVKSMVEGGNGSITLLSALTCFSKGFLSDPDPRGDPEPRKDPLK